ncbi:hypothetical protein [Methylomarinum vadi]|uniref:hypothetical protein n=1 Tax=Methylomarinum vadi TaxID=438855 RepID=UPI0004DF484B|nr:hypothetical protein [Methylomarinum vadi]
MKKELQVNRGLPDELNEQSLLALFRSAEDEKLKELAENESNYTVCRRMNGIGHAAGLKYLPLLMRRLSN